MDLEIPEAFQKDLTCLVCLNFLLDPVTIGCGHSFCRSCLCLFWEQAEAPASCPVCRQRSEQTNFKTNFLLKNLVSTVRKANLRQFLKCEEHLCGTHKQTKTIFCEADKSLLCLVCCQCQEHKTHRHCPAEEAAEESWEKLTNQMRSLWEKIQETERNLKKNHRGTYPWMFYVYRHRDMIRRTYQMAPPFLPEEEDYYVESIVKEGQNICKQLRRRQEEIIRKKRELQEIHKELIQMCSKPDVELLQELEDKLKWSESAQLHMPQPLVPELPAPPMSGLMDWLNRFRGILTDAYSPVPRAVHEHLPVLFARGEALVSQCSKILGCSTIMPLYIERPQGRVGVFLDCDSGSISFVDVAKRTLLWRYDDGVCTFPVRPFICTGHR
nr:tripartite motif-containing protein 43-like [Odocoileus virginianus texanus]